MKKKVAVIAGILFPSPSPPGRIAQQYVNMIKDDCDVTMIYVRSMGDAMNGDVQDGIAYYSVSGFRFSFENYFLKKNKISLVRLCKAIGRIQRYGSVNGNLAWFYKKAYNRLNEICRGQSIDVVFSICNPFQAHLAALKFKRRNPSTRFVTYTVDPFVKGYQFTGVKLRKALKLEKAVYEKADHNFVSEEIFGTEQEKLRDVLHKTQILPYHLTNIRRDVQNNYFDHGKVNLVYAGNFYQDIRNPEFMLESILSLEDERIVLHLYCGGECQHIVNSYVDKSRGRIVRHPVVPHEEIILIMNACDFLVNVSNNVKEFQPSKTFEYVATGKPVINFYEGDNHDKVFAKYPLCIQVSKANMKLPELPSFIKDNCGRQLDFADVERIYPDNTYGSVRDKLLKAIIGTVHE